MSAFGGITVQLSPDLMLYSTFSYNKLVRAMEQEFHIHNTLQNIHPRLRDGSSHVGYWC